MKKSVIILLAGCLMLSLAACSPGGNGNQPPAQESPQTQAASQAQESSQAQAASQAQESSQAQAASQAQESSQTQAASQAPGSGKPEKEPSSAEEQTGATAETGAEFTYDYSEDIKAEIDNAVSSSSSLQTELENVETILQKYNRLAEKAQSQNEMNLSSQWPFVVWDTELNSLWSRFSDSADPQTKERILTDQRNWISMKEEASLECIGTSEENGSMYPLLANAFLEEITRNRAYILANELAKVKGESFTMPEKSKYGLFVDNQGTGSIYSSLITRQGESGDNEAYIGIFRLGY